MRVAFGLKAHSGWAALVVVGNNESDYVVVDRRRIELVTEEWQRQPYHAADGLEKNRARDLVKRGISAARTGAQRELRAAVKRETGRKNEIDSCAVLVSDPMPDWTTEQILAVHFRMHKAEGVLFKEALVAAAGNCGLKSVPIPEKLLTKHAETTLGSSIDQLANIVAALGKSVGPPWGKDQKEAALAALVALKTPHSFASKVAPLGAQCL